MHKERYESGRCSVRTRVAVHVCDGHSIRPQIDVRDIKKNKTNIPVIVWYAEDDEDCPPSHGVWLVEEFGGKSRLFSGLGHVGAVFVDHVKFLDEVRMAA
mmetsp:Transcript_37811/g.55783  ORF Transcript_37811/g.55783 Transcript_37811/m.55783 type:complete len:100 (+) Transcript_37811:795-1094(+)